jgi:hypothetical protein
MKHRGCELPVLFGGVSMKLTKTENEILAKIKAEGRIWLEHGFHTGGDIQWGVRDLKAARKLEDKGFIRLVVENTVQIPKREYGSVFITSRKYEKVGD